MRIIPIQKRTLQGKASEERWTPDALSAINKITNEWLDSGHASSVLFFFKENSRGNLHAYMPIIAASYDQEIPEIDDLDRVNGITKIIGANPYPLEDEKPSKQDIINIARTMREYYYWHGSEAFIMSENRSIQELDMGNIIFIISDKEWIDLFKRIDDLTYLKSNSYVITGPLVEIKFEGENYNSSLPSSVIEAIASYPKIIKELVPLINHHLGPIYGLTLEKSKLLQLNIKITQGCTEVLITMLHEALLTEFIDELMKNPKTVIAAVCILLVLKCLMCIGLDVVKEIIKDKLKSLIDKKSSSNDEQEKKELEMLVETVSMVNEAIRVVSKGIIEANPNEVRIGGRPPYKKNRLERFVKQLPEMPNENALEQEIELIGSSLIVATEKMLKESEERNEVKLTDIKNEIEAVKKMLPKMPNSSEESPLSGKKEEKSSEKKGARESPRRRETMEHVGVPD